MSELNEKERENLPDREIAEKNSVYKISEEAGKKYLSPDELLAGKKDEAPARKIAEKNSVYKIAEEAGEKYGHEAERAQDATRNNYNNQSGSQSGNSRGNTSNDSGRQSSDSRGSMNNDTGMGGGNSRSNRNDDTGIGGGYDPSSGTGGKNDKVGTNSLRETVKLDNDTFDGRSKLDGTPGETWDDPKAMEGAMASAPRDKRAHRIPPAQQGKGQSQRNPTDYDKFSASEVPPRSNAATDRNTYDFNDTLADETTEQARNRRQRNQ